VVTVSNSDPGNAVSAEVAGELARLRAENGRLLRLLKLTRREAAPPGPVQAGFFDAPPGLVHAASPPEAKVALFGALFAARTDIYAVRWENARTGQKGWLPAVRGGWRKGVPHAERDYRPLTAEVLSAHLSGQVHVGLYPLLDGDRCWWLAADFDGTAAMLDALNYIKAARALGVPAGLEVSRSGTGAHAWTFLATSGRRPDRIPGALQHRPAPPGIAQRVPDDERDVPRVTVTDIDTQQIRRKPVLNSLINEYTHAA
jgi:hypothetical protein